MAALMNNKAKHYCRNFSKQKDFDLCIVLVYYACCFLLLEMFMPIFLRPNLLIVLILGFASGLPLALTTSVLRIWLTEAGIDIKTVGLASLLGMPYILKPLWAPFLDSVFLPYIGKRFGLRRSWLLIVQAALAVSIMLLGMQNPQHNLFLFFSIAILVAFLSATQDDIIDAFRIELLKDEEQGAGSSYAQLGYRVAMLFSGAGTLFLAETYGWQFAHWVMGMALMPTLLLIFWLREPSQIQRNYLQTGYFAWFVHAFIDPFKEFAQRANWALILLFIVLFKLGDAYLGALTPTFIIEMGYSKTEYATVVKLYGFYATIAGIVFGGWVYQYFKLSYMLGIACILQSMSNLLFIWLLYAGHNVWALGIVNCAENFTGAIGGTAFIGYASMLCNRQFTATQYALLSALAALGRVVVSSSSGYLQAYLGWVDFILFSAVLSLPALLMVRYITPETKQY
jgi:MFS transporter, PAT family, beta-lactamase induction signal transducer AmpG